MRRTLVLVLAAASLVATNARAADVDLFPFKAPPQFQDPLPDSLTWYGVTLIRDG